MAWQLATLFFFVCLSGIARLAFGVFFWGPRSGLSFAGKRRTPTVSVRVFAALSGPLSGPSFCVALFHTVGPCLRAVGNLCDMGCPSGFVGCSGNGVKKQALQDLAGFCG